MGSADPEDKDPTLWDGNSRRPRFCGSRFNRPGVDRIGLLGVRLGRHASCSGADDCPMLIIIAILLFILVLSTEVGQAIVGFVLVAACCLVALVLLPTPPIPPAAGATTTTTSMTAGAGARRGTTDELWRDPARLCVAGGRVLAAGAGALVEALSAPPPPHRAAGLHIHPQEMREVLQ